MIRNATGVERLEQAREHICSPTWYDTSTAPILLEPLDQLSWRRHAGDRNQLQQTWLAAALVGLNIIPTPAPAEVASYAKSVINCLSGRSAAGTSPSPGLIPTDFERKLEVSHRRDPSPLGLTR